MEVSKITGKNMLSLLECEKLPTPRLLKYYKTYRGWRNVGMCDCGCDCGYIYPEYAEAHGVMNEYLDAMRLILNSREHVC